MKEIIKYGTSKYAGKCDVCGTEFTYTLEDIEDVAVVRKERAYMVQCPYCHYWLPHKLEFTTKKLLEDNSHS